MKHSTEKERSMASQHHPLESSQSTRMEALQNKHSRLSRRIEQEQRNPSTTDFFLRQLKKQKLALKEEIEGIRTSGAVSVA